MGVIVDPSPELRKNQSSGKESVSQELNLYHFLLSEILEDVFGFYCLQLYKSPSNCNEIHQPVLVLLFLPTTIDRGMLAPPFLH